MQLDVKDAYAEVSFPNMLKIAKEYSHYLEKNDFETVTSLIKKLEKWDFQVTADSEPALIFNVWETLLQKKFLGSMKDKDQGELIVHSLQFEPFLITRVQSWANKLAPLDEEFCLNEENKNKKTIACPFNVVKALADVKTFILTNIGKNIDYWKWGTIHRNVYKHIPFSQTALRYLYERSHSADGNRRTINVAVPNNQAYQQQIGAEKNFDGYHSANFRTIISLGEDTDKSLWILDTGVSESYFSRHYDDQYYLHREGRYLNLTCGLKNFDNLTNYQHTLTLQG
jgi:penicillin G amidase